MLPCKGLNRDVEVSLEFTQVDATLTIVLSPNLQFAKIASQTGLEFYLVNKQKRQRHSTSQICGNAEQRYILLCSVARHFQDTASEKVECLQHRRSLTQRGTV